MIKQQHRFHRRNDISYVYKKGQTVRGQHLSLRFVALSADKPYRLAIVVSKKVDKLAVNRNRIRRRIYEIVRLAEPYMKIPADMILSIHSNAVKDVPTEDMNKIIKDLLQKAGAL